MIKMGDKTKPNILLFVLDATRVDVCTCYGRDPHPVSATPTIDKLAREGMLFEQAISAAPWTLPAITSIFTGLYPSQTDIYLKRELDGRFPTLAQLLADGGYATFGISNNDWLSVDFGLQRGFDVMHKLWQLFQTEDDITNLSIVEKDRSKSHLARRALHHSLQGNIVKNMANTAYYKFFRYRKDYGASRTFKPLTKWIKNQKKPWFAFIHYLDPHLQYKPPQTFAKRYAHDWARCRKLLKSDQWRLCWRHIAGVESLSDADLQAWKDLYLAEVAYTDFHLSQVIEWLKSTNRLENTMIIVTADHGDNLGEHGLLNHSYSLNETLIHVPLIIRYPQIFNPGQRQAALVQTLDLFATILEVVGIQIPPDSASRSLLSSENRQTTLSEYGAPLPPHPSALERFGITTADLTQWQFGLSALRTQKSKYILRSDGFEQLYDLRQDPGELVNLSDKQPAELAEHQAMLNSFWSKHNIDGLIGAPDRENIQVDTQVEERLQALGYLE